MLEAIGEDIWTCPAPFKAGGILSLNGRMTVVRLPDGALWLHSPVRISDALRAAVDALGTVRHLVAPSNLHHLFVPDWKSAYPEAVVYGVRGLEKKHADIDFRWIGAGEEPVSWEGLEPLPIAGIPSVNEVLFFHYPSHTLIVTDFLFYMPDASGFTSAYAWLNGFKQRVSSPPVFRMLIRDKAAFRQSLAPLRSWSTAQISMCHHAICREDAAAALQGALDALRVPAS